MWGINQHKSEPAKRLGWANPVNLCLLDVLGFVGVTLQQLPACLFKYYKRRMPSPSFCSDKWKTLLNAVYSVKFVVLEHLEHHFWWRFELQGENKDWLWRCSCSGGGCDLQPFPSGCSCPCSEGIVGTGMTALLSRDVTLHQHSLRH